MRILVTGAKGFIGTHVVRELRVAGYLVDELDWPQNLCELRKLPLGCKAVVNLAALGGAGRAARDPAELVKNNVGATIALREATRDLAAPDLPATWPIVIHVSSFSVYGNAQTPTDEAAALSPLEVYGASKLMQELCWTGYPGRIAILRLSSVYGPGMRLDDPETTVIAKIAKAARDREEFQVFEDGKQARDWVHVLDVVDTIRAFLGRINAWDLPIWPYEVGRSRLGPRIVNVCSGRRTSILEACAVLGARYTVTNVARPGDMRVCLGNPTRMRALLGHDPRPFTPRDIFSQQPVTA